MARASITFEDDDQGVLLTLNFDTDLPEDPEQATQAQMEAMIAFQAWVNATHADEDEVTLDFDDGDDPDRPIVGREV